MLVAAALVVLAGCEPSPGDVRPTPSTSTAPPTGATTSAAAGPRYGAPSCDRYVEQVEACIARLPESERAARLTALEASKLSWKDPPAAGEGVSQREIACRAALTAFEATPCP
jgi:hypothetical protein